MCNEIRAAVVQAEPVLLDADRGVEKVCRLIHEAGKNGARVVAFGETVIPSYPFWADAGTFARWNDRAGKEIHSRTIESSLEVPSPATERIGEAARAAGAVVVIGVSERDRRARSLWNALLTFDEKGTLIGHRRKLVPTFAERLVWAPGDAADLRAHQTAAGRIGGLICWEHWMPAARQVLHDEGETIHVAAWPHVREIYLVASRHYAFEGRCWVLAAATTLRRDTVLASGIPVEDLFPEGLPDPILLGGGAIIAPDGTVVAGPAGSEETILYADLDLRAPARESLALDAGGHYARPDLFSLQVRRDRRSHVTGAATTAPPRRGAPHAGPNRRSPAASRVRPKRRARR